MKSTLFKLLLTFFLVLNINAHDHKFLSDILIQKNLFATVKLKNYSLDMMKLNSYHLDFLGVNLVQREASFLIDENEYHFLKANGFEVQIVATSNFLRGPDSEYKTPDEVADILMSFQRQYPKISKVVEIGKSLRGRTIYALKISENVEEEKSFKPAVLFNGMHHAREVMGPEVSLDIAEYLLSNHASNSQVNEWIRKNEIWILPMFNVDGNQIVWDQNSMWRKNARENYGVDLNRNYPATWGACNGSSTSKNAQDYRGPAPASEPETQVMMNLVKKIRPVFNISYHSFSELVLYPMGCKNQRTKNFDVVETIGQEMGSLINYRAGTPWEILYSADGSDIDWMYLEYQVIPYVIELNSSIEGFQPPFSKRKPTVERNRAAWQHLLKRLDESGLRGIVTSNGESVSNFKAKLKMKTSKGFVSYMDYQSKEDGTFHAVLNPGEYQLEIEANGFEKMIKTMIIEKHRIDESIELKRI